MQSYLKLVFLSARQRQCTVGEPELVKGLVAGLCAQCPHLICSCRGWTDKEGMGAARQHLTRNAGVHPFPCFIAN